MKTFEFEPQGVCSRKIYLELENGQIKEVEFLGGCDGNLQGICQLVRGMEAVEVIRRLKGLNCGRKETSCPDQLAQALEIAVRKYEKD
ncbi:MAG: TIGR03905 family TSCPD domain-containing protein [Anaerolinea sp.]|nr:TIGR03905 family TSCPD domain-containing protein [Anaerolinea thermophila]